MEIRNTYKFPAPPQKVWTLLMDPEAIKSCLPGCRELQPVGGDRYQAEMSIGVGAVSGSFSAAVTLSDEVVATAEVGGLIARVGQRLIDGVAKMTMDRFFGCLAERVQSAP